MRAQIIKYRALIVLFVCTLLAACALTSKMPLNMSTFMHFFMGLFLLVFAMLKLFSPAAFADGFEKYDLLAKQYRTYAYVYPYLELILALFYLGFWWPQWVYLATILLFGFGSIGVVSALRRGLNINCPCMGSVLKVPLSTVTLAENLTMILMALVLLCQCFIT